MEKEKKQFTISDYIIVIVGFLVMLALVVFWSIPAHASTQQVCDYKLTEQDQDFVAWYKKNVADNERYNKLDYVVIQINRFTLLKKVQIVFRRERILSIICLRSTVPVRIANTFLIRKILGLIIMQVLILVLSMYSVTITLVL